MITLRPEQKKDVAEIIEKLKEGNEVGYTAPPDYGKTLVAVSASLKLGLPVTFFTTTYEGIQEVIRSLTLLDVKDKLVIVLPRGKDKVREEVCKCSSKECKECIKEKHINIALDKKDFKGKIVTPESISLDYPDYCPYNFLIELCSGTIPDYIVTHWDTFNKGRLRTHGNVILDEVDESLKRTDMLWVRYDISANGWHLETSAEVTPLKDVLKILNLIENERCPYDKGTEDYDIMMYWAESLKKVTEFMIQQIEQNPIIYEIESLKRYSENGKVKDEDLQYGLMTAYHGIEEKVNKFWHPYIKTGLFTASIENILSNWQDNYVSKLPEDEDKDKMRKVMYVFGNLDGAYFKHVNFSPVEKKGYIEVWLITGTSKIQRKLEEAGYEKKLYISATFPSNINVPIVANKTDLNADKKLIVLVDTNTILNKVLKEIQPRYNILGVTTSLWRAESAEKEFQGGLIRKHDDFKKLLDYKLKRSKGYICWTYFGSKFSRASNDLNVFDGCVFKDYLDRTDHLSFGNEEEYKENCVRKLYQAVSRIFRTVNNYHRRRFLLTSNEEAFERLKALMPSWIYKKASSTKEAVDFIDKHAEPFISEPWKPPLKGTAYKRKDTSKLFISIPVPEDYEVLEGTTVEIPEWTWNELKKELPNKPVKEKKKEKDSKNENNSGNLR